MQNEKMSVALDRFLKRNALGESFKEWEAGARVGFEAGWRAYHRSHQGVGARKRGREQRKVRRAAKELVS